MPRFALSASILLLLAACSSSDPVTTDGVSDPGGRIPDGGEASAPGEVHLMPADQHSPPDDGAAPAADGLTDCCPDALGETWGLCLVPGGFGCPCESAEECLEGWCVDSRHGDVCTSTCIEECPAGFECTQTGSATDPVFVCLPSHLWLCRPCTDSAQCYEGMPADTGDRCVKLGPQGAFCGGHCKSNDDCPPGYSCLEGKTTEGGVVKQCAPDGLACDCTPKFVAAGSATDCYEENEFGSCPGKAECSPEGITACDAVTPAAENCNGQDDDCDGEIDEGFDGEECEISGEWGVCTGSLSCHQGEWNCAGDGALPEECNGVDDDCDDQVDEGFVNSDGEGAADCIDIDDDNDGIEDEADNCPLTVNPDQLDFDTDSLGDECDDDDDGDLDPDATDCDPLNPLVHHSTIEDCTTEEDDDCNGSANDENAAGCILFFADEDDDGYGGDLSACFCVPYGFYTAAGAGDCQDQDAAVKPGLPELCAVPGDDNCDGQADDATATDCAEFYLDEDQDGFGSGAPVCACLPAGKYTASAANDCEDSLTDVFPGAEEVCDGLDNNCNNFVDEQFPDSDLDGAADCVDPDDDNDGTPDIDDCQPFNPAVPACAGKECGDDGCGGSCGVCPGGTGCVNFHCSCQSNCAGKQCGDDGCGGSCGTCPGGYVCQNGLCQCLPNCGGKQCGADGCGGTCGSCNQGYHCTPNGICEADPNPCGNITWAGQCIGNVLKFCHQPGNPASPCLQPPNCTLSSGDCGTSCWSSGFFNGICTAGNQPGICWPENYCSYCECF